MSRKGMILGTSFGFLFCVLCLVMAAIMGGCGRDVVYDAPDDPAVVNVPFPVPVPTPACGPGTTAVDGQCLPSKLSPVYGEGAVETGEECLSVEEICNGKDDDCDGQVDESDHAIGLECVVARNGGIPTRGQYDCAATGNLHCYESCVQRDLCGNGVDDDCDGKVDGGCLDSPCTKNTNCLYNLICTHPALGGRCRPPCGPITGYAACPTGTSCFWTWDDPACPIDEACPTDSWTCLPI